MKSIVEIPVGLHSGFWNKELPFHAAACKHEGLQPIMKIEDVHTESAMRRAVKLLEPTMKSPQCESHNL